MVLLFLYLAQRHRQQISNSHFDFLKFLFVLTSYSNLHLSPSHICVTCLWMILKLWRVFCGVCVCFSLSLVVRLGFLSILKNQQLHFVRGSGDGALTCCDFHVAAVNCVIFLSTLNCKPYLQEMCYISCSLLLAVMKLDCSRRLRIK